MDHKDLDEEGWTNAVNGVPVETGRILIRTLYEIEGDFVVEADGAKSFLQDNSTSRNIGILSWKKVAIPEAQVPVIDNTP